ncbi:MULTISPECIES: RelA/SpoT family protein [Brachybacterium]|uniref:Bifunctional (P)ppGpp synthetase/guanosine-3',5'-bis(Diphosphate) 3'-pyrophosphohydrolase n=2 Tax=Brachybacterium TaxID=43668 RepID=A0A426SGC9_9MICO|nr:MULTISPECIES: bifunctional (p)ppGpp synthetase/guanosine-3',5'-bis(diphosphate) 3'-pyrophosphohydrolase [Brachybacterium]RRR17109.1 bifunctional (p)ppGpp synthetase/guanosine-3',5'-bis(diphosphate) 3'-pyrophosphohydrolase [Brachybacterium paraconglomeratum]GLI31632.1 GTP pyrophosphokinase [Brachybacterium conglomeratum]GLK06344.1 GTP pyrophosphokinase [Brachybacterium conglomeratum]
MQERTASEQAGAEAGPADQAARPPAAPPAQPDSPRTPSTAPRRSRSRLSFFAPRSSPVDPLLAPLLETMTAVSPKENQELVRQAYTVAERAHRGQTRRSGDPYITHPVSVATILAELGSPADVVAAALLHDTVEDTDYSLDQLRAEFGEVIAVMVDGVTKLDKVTYGEAAQAETVRKMIVAMSRDVRVLLIKLADRLHNARTWKYVPAASAERKAKETLEIYAPLAHRLGLNTMKWELEDRSFQVLYPKVYEEIVSLVAQHAPAREQYLSTVSSQIQEDLKKARIKAEVTGRPKHYYSIYQKMIVRGRDFSDIYDLVGVRVLVDTVRDCYGVLGTLHARWSPVQGRFKDYIALPKFNLYQSLHTTVIGPTGKPVEVQIRTREMHRRAEYGVAAHWKYKAMAGGQGGGESAAITNDAAWLRQLMDWQKETTDSGEFLDSLRFEINTQEVYVFTPKGDVLALPQGSTPVDFAYSVHTEVGHRTIGARVNGRLVSLESALATGDVVEVFTSKSADAGPSRDWLGFVKSPRARNKIRQWFSKERREEALERGKEELAKALRRQDLPMRRLLTHDTLATIASELNLGSIDALYTSIGEGHTGAQHVVEKLRASFGGADGAEEDLAEITLPSKVRPRGSRAERHTAETDQGVIVGGHADLWVKLAKCCAPVPGDPIVGFITRGSGISVHHTSCTNATQLQQQQPDRMVEASWSGRHSTAYLVHIKVEALDRPRLLTDLALVISEQQVNLQSASAQSNTDRLATTFFSFELADPAHLQSVLAQVRRVEGVYDVYRVTADGRPVGLGAPLTAS